MSLRKISPWAAAILAVALTPAVAPGLSLTPSESDSAAISSLQASGSTKGIRTGTSQATLPLQWTVPSARRTTNRHTSCSTAVTVVVSPDLPDATTLVTIEVEWFSDGGGSEAVSTFPTAHPGYRVTFVTDRRVTPPFGVADIDANLQDFTGYARVHANENDIYVSGQTYCRKGTRQNAPLVASHSIAAIEE